MVKEISVIVPVYNSEKYLGRCIDSILNQSFKTFELILVDDGSIDSSGKICDQYMQRDSRIFAIHQKNQGVSVARNTGIKKASGKYIVFVDSDDFIDKDLLFRLNQSDADLVMAGFSDYYNDRVTKVILDKNETWETISEKGILNFLAKKSSVFVWGKRYKKDIIDKYGIKFRENMPFNEDNIFNNDYILKIKSAVNIEWSGYYHCQYQALTLSSAAEQVPFIKHTQWRKIAFYQFQDYPQIQDVYVRQMLYFAEKELISISNEKKSLLEKYEEIAGIVNDPFFEKCLQLMPEIFPKDARLYCRHKWIIFLILKYRGIVEKDV